MKKTILLSMIAISLMADVSIGEFKMKSPVMSAGSLSIEHGGTKSMIDAYSDGVGVIILGESYTPDNTAVNNLVYKYGKDAKKASSSLPDYVLGLASASAEDKVLAQKIKDNLANSQYLNPGDACDDGDPTTMSDIVQADGTCVGKPAASGCIGGPEDPLYMNDNNEFRQFITDYFAGNHTTEEVSNLCTSAVTDMSGLFQNRGFNSDISKWDTSNVENMKMMFYKDYAFNQPIGNWDVSKVTDMSYMFYKDHNFNQPIGNWDTSNVINMGYMFCHDSDFNQPIGNWNTSNVTNMKELFYDVPDFNQPIGNWNTSNVTDMNMMFYNTDFNQPIGNWDTSNVTDMYGMFLSAHNFNQDISTWNVNKVNGHYNFSTGSSLDNTNKPNFP